MSDHEHPRGVTILADGEGQLGFLKHFRVREGLITHMAALPRGMASGNASVAFIGKLRDGSYAFLQTSLRVALNALTQWQAAYGYGGDGGPPQLNDLTRQRLNVAMLLKLIRDRDGSEVTFNLDDLNAVMGDPTQDFEIQYGEDGKTITLRATRSD